MATTATVPKPLTDAESIELTGSVKQVMQSCYKAHQREGVVTQGKLELDYSSRNLNFIATFDEKGHKTEETLFGTDGIHRKTFNQSGQPIKDVHEMNGKLYQTALHTYNEQGGPLEFITLNADNSVAHRHIYKYNDNGQQVESSFYVSRNGKEILFSRTAVTYDDKVHTVVNGIKYSNLLSSIEYDGEGNIKRKYVNTYNEQGKMTESITEYTEPEKQKYNSRHTQKYNKQGDCIEHIFYNADGSIKNEYHYTYEYDSEGKRIIPEPNKNHKPYNPFEKKPGETEERVDDARGNWTKKTTFFEKRPMNIFIRTLVYHDEPDKELVHPCTTAAPEEVKDNSNPLPEMEAKDVQWIAEAPNAAPENFSALRFYTMLFNEIPSLVTYSGPSIAAIALLNELKKSMSAQMVYSQSNNWNGYERLSKYAILFPSYQGYMLSANSISYQDDDEFVVPSDVETDGSGTIAISTLQLLRPCDVSELKDEGFEEWLNGFIEQCLLRKKPDKPTINMIEVQGNNFSLREHPVDDNFEIRDLDLNYGHGFQKFHDELMQRFHSSTKGLVLFHGLPGTGKTYYIRHLLRKMVSKNRKSVIYMPPNMVDHLVDPVFMTFLMREIQDLSADGFFCVLLIEDAEPLLAKRVEGVRIQGVTNLLNMSDGLLNDMLNLQIICTFNVDLRKLDSALLRPGRLIARKEFKPLPELEANILAQRLGIKKPIKSEATLGEIYAMRKNQNTLIHDVEQDKGSSTTIDDLI
jgi:hypothetical protein